MWERLPRLCSGRPLTGAVAVRSASAIAVSAIGALAPLGFIHEDFGMAFVLDIADLFRGRFTLPIEFKAVKSLGTPTRDF